VDAWFFARKFGNGNDANTGGKYWLSPYFLKKGILNGFRPCSLTAFRFAQKRAYHLVIGQTCPRPVPAMTENKKGFPEGEKKIFSQWKKPGTATAGPTAGIWGDSEPRRAGFSTGE
jgi:hypothetical protein